MSTAISALAEPPVRPILAGTDEDLVAAVRRGDDRAFEGLYDRYRRRIASYVHGMVGDYARAEDVTQEVFISALRRMRETERPIAFKPWVYEIARNACIDQFRRSQRAEELSYDADGGLPAADQVRLVASDPGPDAAVDARQQLTDLCGAFGGLSDAHHRILVLRELEGLSYREIGEQMSMSRPAVESTLFRARRRLAAEYDELRTGRRCERVQATLSTAAEGLPGVRDRRSVSRHLSYCQACRHHARLVGVDESALQRPGIASRLAALLPIPGFLRRGRAPEASSGGPGSSAHWSSALAGAVEPLAAGWVKAVAAATSLAVAGLGAGVATHEDAPIPSPLGDSPVVRALGVQATDAVASRVGWVAPVPAWEHEDGIFVGRRPAPGPTRPIGSPAGRRPPVERSGGGSLSVPDLTSHTGLRAPASPLPPVTSPGPSTLGMPAAPDTPKTLPPTDPTSVQVGRPAAPAPSTPPGTLREPDIGRVRALLG
jgi:RNA polymerase sigma factor (sigma-70 family)